MLRILILSAIVAIILCLPTEAKLFCTFYGGNHLSSCLTDFEEVKGDKEKIKAELKKNFRRLERFWEIGIEVGFSCPYFSIGAIYKAVALTPVNDPNHVNSISLGNLRESTVGLRLGTPVFKKAIQFRLLLALDKTKVSLYYPGFRDPGGSKTTLVGIEADLSICLTPSRLCRYGRCGFSRFPLDIGIGAKAGLQRPTQAFFDVKGNPTHGYAGLFLRLGFL